VGKTMRNIVFFLIVFSQLWNATTAKSSDYSKMYARQELIKSSKIYSDNLRGVWEHDLLGRLTRSEQKQARNIKLNLPLLGQNKYPFDYYANPLRREVFIPIFSVKFLDDMAIAIAWLERHGCSSEAALDYVGAIRYQPQSKHRFVPPLVALGIPDDALEDAFVNDVSGKILKSAIYFLMAHELAHVIYQHKGYKQITSRQAQQQEKESDAFALNLMRRIGVPPAGMAPFFAMASRFESAPGDFDSLSKYEDYLRDRLTHPLTSARLLSIAQKIRKNVNSFTREQTDPRAWRPRIFSMANDISKIGEILDDHAMREFQRRRSIQIDFKGLSKSCRK